MKGGRSRLVLDINKMWYHGSNIEIQLFNPNSFDLGNSLEKPGWSTFCFNKYQYTENFAIMRLIQNYYAKIKNEKNKVFLHNNRCTWDFINEKAITTQEGLDFILKNLLNQKIYIHIFDPSKLKLKGIGNDTTHNEFTFRDSNVKPIKINTVILNEKKLKQAIMIVQDVNKYRDELVRLSKYYNRGFNTLFIKFDYTINRNEIEKIIIAINDNKLNVGEDISDFIIKNNIKIKKIPVIVRFRNAICGIFSHTLLKKIFKMKLEKFNQGI